MTQPHPAPAFEDERAEARLPLPADDDHASAPPRSDAEVAPRPPLRWQVNALLFLATVLSTFFAGAQYVGSYDPEGGDLAVLRVLHTGWPFAVPLLAILLTHEFGHYFAARWHKVDASLPYFIPLPKLSFIGTMGAVIHMRGRIRSRNALLDIGASGPLAGLCVAIPVLMIGLAHSEVAPLTPHGSLEGQSLLYLALKRIVVGPIPDGYDVYLHPTAFAGWVGLLVTALNLIPVGQLDGGHIAYALFGERQNRAARWIHRGLLLMFAYNVSIFLVPVIVARDFAFEPVAIAIGNSLFWLLWYGLLHLLARVGGRDHPPTEPGALSPVRRGIAALSLICFVLLFMPTPWSTR